MRVRNNMGVKEDRISKLPDPLLHHILLFLPTKSAVSTTVLSKRWNNVWVSLPVLDFRNLEPRRIVYNSYFGEQGTILKTEANKFMDFVDRVLTQRNMLNIKRFCLNCENGFIDHMRVRAWITTAIKCEVEEFIFYGCLSFLSNCKMIPYSLFTSETLTTLDLQYPDEHQLDLPDSISFPRLKILRLTNILYNDEKLVGNLFSSCPVLEEFCLTNCLWYKFDVIRVTAPRLKSFTLTGCSSNLEHVKVKINAPNLKSFTWSDWLPEDSIGDSFPLLHDADICFDYDDKESKFDSLSKFLMKLCNVKLLKMSGAYFKIFKISKVLSTSFPTFRDLIRLEVYNIQMATLLKFLEFSPNLESLVINQVRNGAVVNGNVSTYKIIPQCVVWCLKSIEIRKFTGYLEMVKFVLKHARNLEMVTIDHYYTMEDHPDPRKRKKKCMEAKYVEDSKNSLMTILRQSCTWASASCVIKFSSS